MASYGKGGVPMAGLWYQCYWVLWCVSWGLLRVVVVAVMRRRRLGGSIASHVPLLVLLVFVLGFIPLVVFGVVH
jgi:hypothetical protein